MPTSRRALIPAVLLLALAASATPAAAGGGGGGHCSPTNGTGATVALEASCFTPTVLRAEKGEAVTFVNVDAYPHTITGVGGWGTAFEEIAGEESLVLRFPREGVYAYTCILHPGMSGAVVVGDALGPGASASTVEVEPAAELERSAEDEAPSEPIATETLDDAEATAATEPSRGGLAWPVVLALAVLTGAAGFGAGRLGRRRTSSAS